MEQKIAKGKMAVSMLIWGSLGLVVRAIPLESAQIVLWRAILGGSVMLVLFLLRKEKPRPGVLRRNLPLLLCSGAVMGGNWAFLFEAYRYTTVSAATLAYYCAPVLVMLAAPVLFKEKLTAPKLAGTAMATLGMVLVAGGGFGGADPVRGVLCGLAAAVMYASVMLMNKFMRGLSGVETTLFQLVGAGIVMVLYVQLTGAGFGALPGGPGLAALLTVGLVHTGLALWLFFSALRVLPAQTSALMSYLDPASALLFSGLFLQEQLSAGQLLGAALVLGGAALGELLPARRTAAR